MNNHIEVVVYSNFIELKISGAAVVHYKWSTAVWERWGSRQDERAERVASLRYLLCKTSQTVM